MTTSRLLILGASGDLTGRYLLRALAELVDHGRLPGGVEIIGVAREPWDTEQFRNHAKQRLDDHASDLSRSSRDSLLRRLSYIRGDVTQADSLRAAVGEGEAPVVAYLALPPTLFPSAISGLASAGMPDVRQFSEVIAELSAWRNGKNAGLSGEPSGPGVVKKLRTGRWPCDSNRPGR
jgi:glucose-6-phosphate 1-dehydrogenase